MLLNKIMNPSCNALKKYMEAYFHEISSTSKNVKVLGLFHEESFCHRHILSWLNLDPFIIDQVNLVVNLPSWDTYSTICKNSKFHDLY